MLLQSNGLARIAWFVCCSSGGSWAVRWLNSGADYGVVFMEMLIIKFIECQESRSLQTAEILKMLLNPNVLIVC